MDFEGDFESHVTVRADGPGGPEALAAWAAARGLKFTHIELARGRTVSQPMVTRQGRGLLRHELDRTRALAGELAGAGFAVTRVKLEAAPWSRGVPLSDDHGASAAPDQYFEHHVKLVLADDADLGMLAAMASAHSAHLSRNARRVRPDGRRERFVTQRCRGVGGASARARLDALLSALTQAGYDVVEVEEEYVVYDSDLSVDAGWIEAEGAGA